MNTLVVTDTEVQFLNPMELLCRDGRFDLIFKYLFIKNYDQYRGVGTFFDDLYSEHIRVFNNFREEHPPKNCKEDFIENFILNYENIKANGFKPNQAVPAINNEGRLLWGAHRLAICAALNIPMPVQIREWDQYFDYRFFQKRNINPFYADYAALQFVKLNPQACMVNLHSIVDTIKDSEVERILSQYGTLYYKKSVQLNENGYVNLKKLCYGFDNWQGEHWIGSAANGYAGARKHARKSMGKHPLRAYVYICGDAQKLRQAKDEIRALLGLGNHSIHTSDSHAEAVQQAETLLNEHSVFAINTRPFQIDTTRLDRHIDELKYWANYYDISLDTLCGVGASPLAAIGARESNDLDFLHSAMEIPQPSSPFTSSHHTQLRYYPYHRNQIIHNPQFHFYYRGVKFATLDVVEQMKRNRAEWPKDMMDAKLARNVLRRGIPASSLKPDPTVVKLNKIRLKALRVLYFAIPKRWRTRCKGLIEGQAYKPLRAQFYHRPVLMHEQSNEAVKNLLESDTACLVGRIGGTEIKCINHYLQHRKGQANPKDYPQKILEEGAFLSGIYPQNPTLFDAFCEAYLSALQKADLMGVWNLPNEAQICETVCPEATLAYAGVLAPFFIPSPWFKALKGKKVLIASPFDAVIKEQYQKRALLFENPDILPEFELVTYPVIQAYGGGHPDFENYTAALEKMKNDLSNLDFDIAIVGAGAYGMPLCAHIKQMGRKAVLMAGSTQLLFGIKGERWDRRSTFPKLYNEHWVYLPESTKPKNLEKITQYESMVPYWGKQKAAKP